MPFERGQRSALDPTKCAGCQVDLVLSRSRVYTVRDVDNVATRICQECRDNGFPQYDPDEAANKRPATSATSASGLQSR